MFDYILYSCLFFLALSIAGAVYRVFKGPSIPDRVIALDTIGINIISITAIISILLHTQAFLSVIMLLGVLAFIGTVAFAKFIEKGSIAKYDRNQ
jgi:multicomponent Na+:H+ antiporter subunit F